MDVGLLVRHLLHVALGKAVPDELPLALDRGLDDRRKRLDGAAVDRQHAGNGELVEHLEHAPEADAVAVFVPAPVRDVGRRRAAGRRRQHRARHGVLGVPFLDIDDHPDRHARAARQLQRRTLGDGRIGDAVGRQHALLVRIGALVRGVVHAAVSSAIAGSAGCWHSPDPAPTWRMARMAAEDQCISGASRSTHFA